jgi:uncharacterized protein (TIGR02996 family)
MTHDEAFLQAILEDPDDVSLRLIYADYLDDRGDPRGEFIRVQCRLALLPEGDPRREGLQATERGLLEGHRGEWVGQLLGLVEHCWFRRGFVEVIRVGGDAFLAHADTIFASAPVQHAELGSCWDGTDTVLSRLSICPYLARLKTIALSFGCYFVSDRGLQALSTLPPLLQRLDSLFAVECDISEAGLGPVVLSPHLLRLRSVSLSECQLEGVSGVRPLAESPQLSHLTSLYLDKSPLGDNGVQALVGSPNWGRLESLGLSACGLRDAGCVALARSPHLSRLTSLSLNGNAIGNRGAVALAKAPHLAGLEYLHLSRNGIRDSGAAALAISPHLGRLHALVLWENSITQAGEEPLKVRFGNRVHL